MAVKGPRQSQGTTREDLKTSVEDKAAIALLRKIASSLNDPKTKKPKLSEELPPAVKAKASSKGTDLKLVIQISGLGS